MSELDWQSALPADLRSDQYEYPAALFEDWKQEEGQEKIMRFEGSDDIPMNVVTNSERVELMAKFATGKALHLACSDSVLVTIARGEYNDAKTFLSGTRKIRQSRLYGDLEKGDIELKAEELGVYEIIWPFDPDKMAEAIEAEQQIAAAA